MERITNAPSSHPLFVVSITSLAAGIGLGALSFLARQSPTAWKPMAVSATLLTATSIVAAALSYQQTASQASHSPASAAPNSDSSESSTPALSATVNTLSDSATVNLIDRNWSCWEEAPREQLREAVQRLQRAYATLEQHSPQKGYSITFRDGDNPSIHLQGHGGQRDTSCPTLVGLPDATTYSQQCTFCLGNHEVTPIEELGPNAYTLQSRSGQLLVIPKAHYAHWFTTPEEEQVSLLEQTYAKRRTAHPAGPVNLHCGSAGAQTVFHLHVRTNIHS